MFTLDYPYSESLRCPTALHHDSHNYYKDTPSGGCGTQPEFRIGVFHNRIAYPYPYRYNREDVQSH